MEIHEGVCYRTADGRNTGPMTYNETATEGWRAPWVYINSMLCPDDMCYPQRYNKDGTVWGRRAGEEGHQIVGLWQPITEEDIKELV